MEDLSINTDHPSRVGMDGIIPSIDKQRCCQRSNNESDCSIMWYEVCNGQSLAS